VVDKTYSLITAKEFKRACNPSNTKECFNYFNTGKQNTKKVLCDLKKCTLWQKLNKIKYSQIRLEL